MQISLVGAGYWGSKLQNELQTIPGVTHVEIIDIKHGKSLDDIQYDNIQIQYPEAPSPSSPFSCNEFRNERRGSNHSTSVQDESSFSRLDNISLHKSVKRVVPSPISSPSIDSIVAAPRPLPRTTHSMQRATIRSLRFPFWIGKPEAPPAKRWIQVPPRKNIRVRVPMQFLVPFGRGKIRVDVRIQELGLGPYILHQTAFLAL